jgi:transcriptional regulator with XRE-family HTH domain
MMAAKDHHGMAPCRTKLGRFVRKRRIEALGYTQVQLAALAGISQSELSNIEIGVGHPGDGLVRRLAAVLQCSPRTLWSMTSPRRPIEPKHELGRLLWQHCIRRGWRLGEVADRLKMTVRQARGFLVRCGPRTTVRTAHRLGAALAIKPEILLPFAGIGRLAPRSPFGALIDKSRKVRGMETTDLARRLGVTKQYIHQLILGRLSLAESNRLLRQLARILGIPSAKLQSLRPVRRIKSIVTSDPFGMFLVERRSALGLSRKYVVRKTGIPLPRYTCFELGTMQPTPEELSRLIEALPRARRS